MTFDGPCCYVSVADILPRTCGFNPSSVEVGFTVDEVAQVEFRVSYTSTSVFPQSVSFHQWFILIFFSDAPKTVQLRTPLNNTFAIHLLWMILKVLHIEGRKTWVIFHLVYYPFFIIQSCHLTLQNTKQLKLDNPVFNLKYERQRSWRCPFRFLLFVSRSTKGSKLRARRSS